MKQSNFVRRLVRVTAPLGLALGTVAAHAAAIDVEDIVTDIAAQAAPVALVGGAILVLMVGIKAFKWVRRAMS